MPRGQLCHAVVFANTHALGSVCQAPCGGEKDSGSKLSLSGTSVTAAPAFDELFQAPRAGHTHCCWLWVGGGEGAPTRPAAAFTPHSNASAAIPCCPLTDEDPEAGEVVSSVQDD